MVPLESFKKYLKQKRKKKSVINRNINTVQIFLNQQPDKKDTKITPSDIDKYVETIEKQGRSAKGFLYVMMNYFQYLEDEKMLSYVAEQRRTRTNKTRKKFQIKDFLGVNQETVRKLNSVNIKNVDQILEQGRTSKQRQRIAQELGISEDEVLEIVCLSDLTRLGHVKRKLARLYYEAGLRSPLEVSKYTPEELHEHFKSYIQSSGWDGMTPNLKDLENNIQNAKKLDKIIDLP